MATYGPGALREFTILRGDQPKRGPTWTFPDSQLVALITGQQTEGKLAIFEQTMAPNGAVPLHINHREDESFYLVDGKYLFDVGGMLHELGPASHVFVPRGVPHRFRCTERGRMVIVCQPAGIESAFDELTSLPTPSDPGAFAAVCQKHGIQVLGPPLPAR